MEISHVGHSTLQSPSNSQIHLRNVLHVPHANKSLVSVNRLARDNRVFFEFHPDHFSIKEQATKKTLLRGRSEGGLYPIKSSSFSSFGNKEALSVAQPSVSLWHHRLGQAATPVVQQILSRHKLSFLRDKNKHVCDACQQGKIHQLPYPKSSSVSTRPLELVFSDVWGPAPKSVGHFSYYVSFIDDFSKYTWVYLIKHKSEVFSCFREFQTLIERQLNCKILAMQTDWGGEYQSLNSFFKQVGISHHVSCPYAH
jgi:histone deacetylase 1/2